MPPPSHVALVPVLTCHEYCWNAAGAWVSLRAGSRAAHVTTTAPTSVATDGFSGFTLGAALFVVLAAGYYLLRRRRTTDGSD